MQPTDNVMRAVITRPLRFQLRRQQSIIKTGSRSPRRIPRPSRPSYVTLYGDGVAMETQHADDTLRDKTKTFRGSGCSR